MTLTTRRLGASGPVVSVEGLGCMGMSEFYGPGDEAGSIATIHRALELLSLIHISLQGGQQTGRRAVALGLPVARGGDPGGQQALGRPHQALQLGQRGVEGGGVGPEQGVGVEVGHEGTQQPGEGGHLRGEAGGGRRSGVIRRHGGHHCRGV